MDGHLEPQLPRYTIDLSAPPIERYQHVAAEFLPHMATVTALFDEVIPRPIFQRLAKLLLRRLYSHEETEELRGIHLVTGVGMHLLVAFNVLLDLLMGCTSGGMRLSPADTMLHFRTLDWGMNPLRKLIVHLDFIKNGARVASTITYVGYVGVLTGVRKDLSVSLNFRPVHNAGTWLANIRFYCHHALVLFGFRPSISSIIRTALFPKDDTQSPLSLGHVLTELPCTPSTAAYLIFCDGERTVTLEKDYNTAVIRSSPDFIVITNHDKAQESSDDDSQSSNAKPAVDGDLKGVLDRVAMNGMFAASNSRKRCMTKCWDDLSFARSNSSEVTTDTNTRQEPLGMICDWLITYPITNALTHFAAVMDPRLGEVVWVKHYPDPRLLWDQLVRQD